jgi:hypothetical protein
MALEDDPRYPKWRAALERLLEARDALDSSRDLPESDPVRQTAEADFAAAKTAYCAIADQL